MSWLSKGLKRLGKTVKKHAGSLLAAGSAAVLGPAAPAAMKAVKALGARYHNAKAQGLRLQPVSVRASIVKQRIGAPGTLAAPSLGDATTMPGGAPLRRASKRRSKAVAPPKAVKASRKGRKVSSGAGKRTAPKGGLDLKALSAAWNAAGKPGKWIDWVKSHR